MDTYMGNNQDPVSLHKYLYANSNPVIYVDPTGNFSIGSVMSAVNTLGTLTTIAQTSYDLFQVASGDKELSAKQIGLSVLTSIGGGKLFALLGKKVLNKRGISAKQVRDCPTKNSFVAGTLIKTSSGFIAIEDIEIGDLVWSYNLVKDQYELSEVTHLIRGEGEYETASIQLNNISFVATENHPLLVGRDIWKNAGDLNSSYDLMSDAGVVNITGVYKDIFNGVVYNLTVANNHNYLITEESVVAHNCPEGLPFGALGVKTPSTTVWKGKGKDKKQRIDVENPNPGQRPGQIHYQDKTGAKYLYDPVTKTFIGAPNSVNKLLSNPEFEAGIKKALRYLGES